jgi:imidazolonepropionase
MIDLLVSHASELLTCRTQPGGAVGAALQELEIIPDGAVAIDAGRILAVGPTSELEKQFPAARQHLNARGSLVSPGLVDCHSHLLYGGSRHEEYERLVTGGRSGGGVRLDSGIRYTVRKTREASDQALHDQALADLDTMLAHGTTILEAKTGYGLDYPTELRLLKIQNTLDHSIEVVSTFLGAHVLPDEYRDRRSEYVDLLVNMTPEARKYAEYCDVTCDPIGFTVEECDRMCAAARAVGFKIRVHADQTGYAGGAELAARWQAASADHLDYIKGNWLKQPNHSYRSRFLK